jgi:hypothetical protein
LISKLCTLPIGTIMPTVVSELVAQVVSATETLEQRLAESSRMPGLFKGLKLPSLHGPSSFNSLEQRQWRKILWLQDRAPAMRRERIYYRGRPCTGTIHNVLQIFCINFSCIVQYEMFYKYNKCLETPQHFLILHLKYRIYTSN